MTLVLKNLQTCVKLNMQQIGKDTNIIRRLMEIDKVDVSVLFVSDYYITKLNESFRKAEGPTDVLAFPVLEVSITVDLITPFYFDNKTQRVWYIFL